MGKGGGKGQLGDVHIANTVSRNDPEIMHAIIFPRAAVPRTKSSGPVVLASDPARRRTQRLEGGARCFLRLCLRR
jgi:hypothetical protein